METSQEAARVLPVKRPGWAGNEEAGFETLGGAELAALAEGVAG